MLTDEELSGHIGVGWHPIVKPVLDVLDKAGFTVAQIKEKFGGLCLYVDAPPDATPTTKGVIHSLILAAENASYKTCEKCGAPGRRTTNRAWIKTWCEKCEREDLAWREDE